MRNVHCRNDEENVEYVKLYTSVGNLAGNCILLTVFIMTVEHSAPCCYKCKYAINVQPVIISTPGGGGGG